MTDRRVPTPEQSRLNDQEMEKGDQIAELSKAYDPRQVEDRTYRFWLDKGYFTPKIDPHSEPFVIIMPPPNVTGELHMGHALTATLEDIMTRWHRMKGQPTLWLPGEDHAGIATQVVVERQLAAEGLTRHATGREEFTSRAWEWATSCRKTIVDQHRKMGVSCDWTRNVFTLDEKPCHAVATTFVRLYEKGLVYRGERIINWCPRCQTALSELEVVHRELQGHFYHIEYPLVGEPGHITVATTRPETMFGDTAVAVHPEDSRYSSMIGKQVAIPVINRPIPVISDAAVDRESGTGALKITPAHDPVDFDVAQRNGLLLVNIFNPDATLNHEAGPYQGSDRFECREALISQLQEEGLLTRTEPHQHAVGHCTRCNTVVEPWASKQWFVKTWPLAQPAIEAVRDGRITIIPEQFVRVYLHWMENIRDWCISRQLWWGHRIPAWYCEHCDQVTVAVEPPERCAGCHSPNIFQESDVLDTWFSSALWPHSTLGWPEDTEDFRYFYPTTVMETGYDILFFWVARMIMMGLENTGQVPFRWVYLHGLIRDEKGEKMSKLRGNVINPLDAIERYGADALRFGIVTGTSAGNDIPLSSGKLEAGRNFANKLWNASRFVLRSLPAGGEVPPLPEDLPMEDRWILSRLDRLVTRMTGLLDDFQFGEAGQQVYEFLWDDFCDWYIELAKIRLNREHAPSPVPVLLQTLDTALRLLHPFMPFITEEVWQKLLPYLPQGETPADSLMMAAYPVARRFSDPQAEEDMSSVIEIIRAIRNARAESRIDPSRRIEAHIHTDKKAAIESQRQAIETLARVHPLTVLHHHEGREDEGAFVMLLRSAEVIIPMTADLDAERQRLEKDRSDLQGRLASLDARLSDEAFLSKAPAAVVEKERGRLVDLQGRLEKVQLRLAQLERLNKGSA